MTWQIYFEGIYEQVYSIQQMNGMVDASLPIKIKVLLKCQLSLD